MKNFTYSLRLCPQVLQCLTPGAVVVVNTAVTQSCSRILAVRGTKIFQKARRAIFSSNRLPELATLSINWVTCFQKEKEVERR